jgi:hypothetical protein
MFKSKSGFIIIAHTICQYEGGKEGITMMSEKDTYRERLESMWGDLSDCPDSD